MKRTQPQQLSTHETAALEPRFAVIILSALLALTAVLAGCSKKDGGAEPAGRPPVLLIAVDGVEWNVVKPLLENGKLPVMEGLMKRGMYGYIESMRPTYSPLIWTSVATGKTPTKHGINHFVYEDFEDGVKQRRYFTSGHRKTKAFWNILSDYDQVVHSVGWWMTYPVEPINGIMVSQTNTADVLVDPREALWKGALLKGVEDQVYPRDFQNHVMDILEDVDESLEDIADNIFGRPPHPLNQFSRLMWDKAAWAVRADVTYERVVKDILSKDKPFDMLAVYFGLTDIVGHRFWRYSYPGEFKFKPDINQIENFGETIDKAYIYADRVIGEIVAMAPKDATIIIMSDHGMHAINKRRPYTPADSPLYQNSGGHPDAPPGFFIASGTGIQTSGTSDMSSLTTVGTMVDVLPTLLVLRGIPLGEDMDGSPMRSILELDLLAETGIEYVPTHDTEKWLAGRHKRQRDAVNQTERLEQLRSLGYIK